MSSVNNQFSSLYPIIHNALFGPQSLITASLPAGDTEIEAILKKLGGQLAEFVQDRFPDWYAEATIGGMVQPITTPLLIGKVSGLASLIKSLSQGFEALRKELDKLTEDERNAFLRILPQALKGPLEKNWKMPLSLQILGSIGVITAKANSCITSIGKKCVTKVLSFAGKLTGSIIGVENQKLLANSLAAVGSHFISDLSKDAGSLFAQASKPFVRGIQAHLTPLLAKLVSDFQHIHEILVNLDHVAKSLPPAKLANILFSSLATFSQINKVAMREWEKKSYASPLEMLQLKMAAVRKTFPSDEINRAIDLLLQGDLSKESLENRAIWLLETALEEQRFSSEENVKILHEFKLFCRQHQLNLLPQHCHRLLEKAFYLKYLAKAPSENPEISFLVDLILSHPSIVNTLFSPEMLMEQIGFIYVKKELFPTLTRKFLPPDFPALLRALSKQSGIDLMDKLSTLFAQNFMRKGVAVLKDQSLIATLLLQCFFNVPIHHLEEFSPSSEDSVEFHSRLVEFCDAIGTNRYPEALKNLSLQKKDEGDIRVLKTKAARELEDLFYTWADQLPFIQKAAVGPFIRSVGNDILNAPTRKDWGLWLLLFAGDLNQGLLDPESIPPLRLLTPDNSENLQAIVKNLFPSLRRVPGLTIFSKPYLEKFDKALEEPDYIAQIGMVEVNLQMQTLTAYTINCLKFHSTQTFPSSIDETLLKKGVELVLRQHVKEMIRNIWGIPFHSPKQELFSKAYIEFLLKQTPAELLSTIKKAVKEPKTIRAKFITDREVALAKDLKRLDAILPHFPQLSRKQSKQEWLDLYARLSDLKVELELLYEGNRDDDSEIVIQPSERSLDDSFKSHYRFIVEDPTPRKLHLLKQKLYQLKSSDVLKKSQEVELLEKEMMWIEEEFKTKKSNICKREEFHYRNIGKFPFSVKRKIEFFGMLLQKSRPLKQEDALDVLKFEYGIGYLDSDSLEIALENIQQCQEMLRQSKRQLLAKRNTEIATDELLVLEKTKALEDALSKEKEGIETQLIFVEFLSHSR